MCVCVTVASVAYLSMALGEGKLKDAIISSQSGDSNKFVGSIAYDVKLPVVFYARYCFWFFNYPLIMVCVVVCLTTLLENMPHTKQHMQNIKLMSSEKMLVNVILCFAMLFFLTVSVIVPSMSASFQRFISWFVGVVLGLNLVNNIRL